jgi:hypothetical protein
MEATVPKFCSLTDGDFLKAGVFRRYHVLGDPINWTDPWGLDPSSDNITRATSGADIAISLVKVAKITSPTKATFFMLGLLADKANILVSFTNDSQGKAWIGFGLSTVGTAAAIASGTITGTLLSGYGLGTAINSLPVYGTNQTIADWWADRIWERLGDSCQ